MVMAAREIAVCAKAMGRFARKFMASGLRVGKEVRVEEKENEKWRRISGMTRELEPHMDAKERREGIRKLVKWIEKWVGKARVGGRESGVGRRESGVGGDRKSVV